MKTCYQAGYVFLKDGAWHVRYREYTPNPVHRSHKLCEAMGEYRSKAAAKRLAEEFLRPLNSGLLTTSNADSLTRFIEDTYLPHVSMNKRPSTHNGYRKMFERYIRERGETSLRSFKTIDCERLLKALADEYGINRTTLAHVKNFLSGAFRYAIRSGVLSGHNPVRDACIPPAGDRGETYAYSVSEIFKMLEVLPGQVEKAVVAVAAFAGLRRGEIRGLRREDYDGVSLGVERNVWETHVGDPKGKRGKGRITAIAPLADILDSYILQLHPKGYLFQTGKGTPANLDFLVRSSIRPTLKEHGIEWHGWHAFRRGLATNLYEMGIPDIVIQSILRHSDVTVTRESYIKRNGMDSRSVDAMKRFESLLAHHCATKPTEEGEAPVVN